MKMKFLTSLAFLLLFSVASFVQAQVVSLKTDNGKSELVRFDPATLQVTETLYSFSTGQPVVPNSFYVDEERGQAIMLTGIGMEMRMAGPQQILQVDLNGEKPERKITMNQTMMMPVLINKGNKLGFISTEKTFNGYGNNDDDNSFVIFNLNTGAPKGSIKLNSISFANVQAPFLGMTTADKNTGVGTVSKKVGIGSPTYIPELDEVVFCALDVMGAYRLYRLDVEGMKVKSSMALDHFIISLDYRMSDGKFVALYVDESNPSQKSMRLGILDPIRGEIVKSTLIRDIDPKEETIETGHVSVNQLTAEALVTANIYYVTMKPGEQPTHVPEGLQNIYAVNDKLEIINFQNPEKMFSKLEVRFPISGERSKQFTLENSVLVFPNPAKDHFKVETSEYSLATGINIYSVDNKLISSYSVLDGALSHTLNVDSMAPGVYFVEIATAGGNVIKKLVVQ